MNKEVSAGGIIFRRIEDGVVFLLIFSARNKTWGFPKGHIEPGETEQQAALREIKEETGLDCLRVVPGFREEDIYNAISHRGLSQGAMIEKHSIYFLYETQNSNIIVDNREIAGFKWVSKCEAESFVAFANLKSFLQKASGLVTGATA